MCVCVVIMQFSNYSKMKEEKNTEKKAKIYATIQEDTKKW